MTDTWILQRFPEASVSPVTAGWSDDRKFRLTLESSGLILNAYACAESPL